MLQDVPVASIIFWRISHFGEVLGESYDAKILDFRTSLDVFSM